jgi:hypothetical protein
LCAGFSFTSHDLCNAVEFPINSLESLVGREHIERKSRHKNLLETFEVFVSRRESEIDGLMRAICCEDERGD